MQSRCASLNLNLIMVVSIIMTDVDAAITATLITTAGGADRHKMRSSSPGSEMR